MITKIMENALIFYQNNSLNSFCKEMYRDHLDNFYVEIGAKLNRVKQLLILILTIFFQSTKTRQDI